MKLKVPRVFSFIENPEETLNFLNTLRQVVSDKSLRDLKIQHRGCEELDLCASVVMDVILMRAREHWKRSRQRVTLHGELPEEGTPAHKLLVNSGVVAHIAQRVHVPDASFQGVKPFDLVRGGLSNPARSARKEDVSSAIVHYFVNCLRSIAFDLRDEAASQLASLVSEVLDNAEQHGNADGDWYVIGHFNQDVESAVGGNCHIVLLNFGDSIYKTLKRGDVPPALPLLLKELTAESNRAVKKPGRFDEAALWTLYALQEGVSRLPPSGGTARGGGTADLIQFLNELSGGNHKLCILSGRAHILDKGTFPPGKDENGYTVLAFNSSNDLNLPPDPAAVGALDGHFPGTLVSVRFPFRPDQLADRLVPSITATVGQQRIVRYDSNESQNDDRPDGESDQ